MITKSILAELAAIKRSEKSTIPASPNDAVIRHLSNNYGEFVRRMNLVEQALEGRLSTAGEIAKINKQLDVLEVFFTQIPKHAYYRFVQDKLAEFENRLQQFGDERRSVTDNLAIETAFRTIDKKLKTVEQFLSTMPAAVAHAEKNRQNKKIDRYLKRQDGV